MYLQWIRAGKVGPTPQIYKIRTLKDYGRRYQTEAFVETGTLYGDTTNAVYPFFKRVVTIELDVDLHRLATERFRSNPRIECVHGDSAEMLPKVLGSITEPTLFWLDGHYSAGVTARGSKDTPIYEELRAILLHEVKAHVILVDDASLFVGENDYPTMDELQSLIEQLGSGYGMGVEHDIIRVHK